MYKASDYIYISEIEKLKSKLSITEKAIDRIDKAVRNLGNHQDVDVEAIRSAITDLQVFLMNK